MPAVHRPIRRETWTEPLQLVGTVLDQRYRILRLLGAGGMGAVFEAEHTTLEKRVAVKVLAPHLARKPEQVQRFLREAQAASKVSNMHVVDISDFGHVPAISVYYVMELLEGADLQHVIRAQVRIPWPRARAILLQIAHALTAAHDQGVVHRDMKPANCVILPDPDDPQRDFVKVVDFGIAKILESDGPGLTRPNEIMGTVAYMAPEQALCRAIDERTDVYALGVVAFEMLTGQVPFHAEHAFDVLEMHCHTPPPSLLALAPGVSAALDQVVQRALMKDPAQRYPDMRSFEHALRSIAEDGRWIEVSAPPPPAPPPLANGPTGISTPALHASQQTSGFSNTVLLTLWIAVLAGGVVLGAWLVTKFL